MRGASGTSIQCTTGVTRRRVDSTLSAVEIPGMSIREEEFGVSVAAAAIGLVMALAITFA